VHSRSRYHASRTKACPMCDMSFALNTEMKSHLFKAHGYVLNKQGLAKPSLRLVYQPTKVTKVKKQRVPVRRLEPQPRSASPTIEAKLLKLEGLTFVKLRARILHNLRMRSWDIPPEEYLRLLQSKLHEQANVKYEINLERGTLSRIEISPAS
jgi:uncharacterized C2H2 Zn-finger protein